MKDCGKRQKAFVCGGKKDLSLHCGTAGSEPGFESNVTMLLSDGRQIETHCGHLFTQFTCLQTFYRYCAKYHLSLLFFLKYFCVVIRIYLYYLCFFSFNNKNRNNCNFIHSKWEAKIKAV